MEAIILTNEEKDVVQSSLSAYISKTENYILNNELEEKIRFLLFKEIEKAKGVQKRIMKLV